MPGGDARPGSGRDHPGMAGVPCRIVLKGDVSERLEPAFSGLTFRRQAGYTELTGTLADQCQLRSLLNWIFDLGMEVVSLRTGSECAHPDGLARPA
jgi:hypothetical protein